jgi:FtsH-binding integral membrane protein
MNKRTANPKQLIGLILMLSSLVLMIGAFAIPQSANLSGTIRFAIAVAGLMDFLFGAVFLFVGRTQR